jgi:hypothetical protein
MATPPKNTAVFMQPPALLENGELNVGQLAENLVRRTWATSTRTTTPT